MAADTVAFSQRKSWRLRGQSSSTGSTSGPCPDSFRPAAKPLAERRGAFPVRVRPSRRLIPCEAGVYGDTRPTGRHDMFRGATHRVRSSFRTSVPTGRRPERGYSCGAVLTQAAMPWTGPTGLRVRGRTALTQSCRDGGLGAARGLRRAGRLRQRGVRLCWQLGRGLPLPPRACGPQEVPEVPHGGCDGEQRGAHIGSLVAHSNLSAQQ